ncbi:MAG: hypothetical protein HOC71_00180 [Candidatus Latescibacteria bacterium]|jgi:hypothetical protein|nr:hypothetical protein [Candidatus Latescibacterota bacterium]
MIEALANFFSALNNRELAIAIWISIAIILGISHPKIRRSLFQSIKAFFAWKLSVSYTLMFAYITVIVLVMNGIGMWKISQLPLTLLWVVCVAFVMLFGFSKANDQHFFKKSITDNIKGLMFLEFLVNLYVFSIWVELILVPVFALFGGMLAIAETDTKYETVKKLLNFIMGSIGLFFISFAIYMAIKDFSHFASFENLENFYMPIILTVGFLPFVYFAALYAGYEMLFIRLGFFVPNVTVLKYAKFKTIIAFNVNLWQLNKWSEHVYSSWRFKSKNEVDEAIIVFKKNEPHEKRKRYKGSLLKNNNSKNLTLVGIHASILSIILAFLAAYGLFVFGNLDELEYRAFSESLKINNVHLISKYRSPRYKFVHLLNKDSKKQYSLILDRIKEITISDLMDRMYSDIKDETELSEIGIELVCNMTVLANIYPFATRIYFDKDGTVKDSEVVSNIQFDTLDEIRQWLEDLDNVILNMNFIFMTRKSRLQELFKKADEEVQKKFPPDINKMSQSDKYTSSDIEDMKRLKNSIISLLVDDFFKGIYEAHNILLSSKKIIEDYDLYDKRHINKSIYSFGIILAFFTFVTSVISPLIFKSVPKIFTIWIPVTFYFIMILYLIMEILFF